MSHTVSEITDFWVKYGYYDVPRERLEDMIRKHIRYSTLLTESNNNEIVGICRFNLIDDTCLCLDVVVKPEYRHKNMLRTFLRRGIAMYPHITKLSFERGLKNKSWKVYDIYKFAGLKSGLKAGIKKESK